MECSAYISCQNFIRFTVISSVIIHFEARNQVLFYAYPEYVYKDDYMASNLITLGSRELQSRGFGNAHSSSILIFASESLFSSHCVFLCLKFVNLTACRFT